MPDLTELQRRMIGAHIVDVQLHPEHGEYIVIEFAHKGTDDDNGEADVLAADVRFDYA